MTVSDAQKRANTNYRKRNMKNVSVSFFPADKDIFEHMEKQGGRGSYIKRLIREDMEREQKGNKQ